MKRTSQGKTRNILLFSAYWLFFVLLENSSALPRNRVKHTEFTCQKSIETAAIHTEDNTRTTHFILNDPKRIVVDLHEAFFPKVNDSKQVRGDIISGIRLHQNQKDLVRVVLDIKENAQYSYTVQKGLDNGSSGVKIIVTPKEISSPMSEKEEIHSASPETEIVVASVLNDVLPDDIFEDNARDDKSDISLSGRIHVRSFIQTSEDEEVENNIGFRNRVLMEGKYKHNLAISILSDYLYFGSENQNEDYEISLHEAKWELLKKNYGFSLGKQIVRWGKTDQISPVDTLNPEDFREFILPEYEERKIPVWMANAHLGSRYFNFEGVFIPFFKKSNIDYFDTNWSVFGHMKKELQDDLQSQPLKTYVNNLAVHETVPENEEEFAFRLQTTLKKIDIGFTFHKMIEDTPYFKSFPIKNLIVDGNFSDNNIAATINPADLTNEAIEVEYKKTQSVGFEFETTWADLGIRGEAVWMENESFLTSSLTSSRNPTFTYVLGADYTSVGNTYFNVQFLHSHIYDYSPEILYFEQDSFSLLGELRADLLSDWLQGILKYNVSLNNNSHYFSPNLKYTYFTNLECTAGAGLFYGDRKTWFGRFRNYDFIYLDIVYQF